MTIHSYIEKLDSFRQNEKPEAVLVIVDNPELIKIVIAWTNVDVHTATKPTELLGNSDSMVWEWLWTNAQYSLRELKIKANVAYSESVLTQKIELLAGNRVLYPDGTINTFVQRYLRERVRRLFETKASARRMGQ